MNKRQQKSNNEIVSFKQKLFNIKEHLAYNKILLGSNYKSDKMVGFFKLVKKDGNEFLQLHVKVQISKDKVEWYWFDVLDATEKEIEINKKLNVREINEI